MRPHARRSPLRNWSIRGSVVDSDTIHDPFLNRVPQAANLAHQVRTLKKFPLCATAGNDQLDIGRTAVDKPQQVGKSDQTVINSHIQLIQNDETIIPAGQCITRRCHAEPGLLDIFRPRVPSVDESPQSELTNLKFGQVTRSQHLSVSGVPLHELDNQNPPAMTSRPQGETKRRSRLSLAIAGVDL